METLWEIIISQEIIIEKNILTLSYNWTQSF